MCGPVAVAVQVALAHDPSGEMVNVVFAVSSPRLLPKASNPAAVYGWLPPGEIVAVDGLRVSENRGPGEVQVT